MTPSWSSTEVRVTGPARRTPSISIRTGGSSIKALEALKAAGLRCQGVIAVVDRQQGGDAAFEAYGRTPFIGLVTMKEVLGE